MESKRVYYYQSPDRLVSLVRVAFLCALLVVLSKVVIALPFIPVPFTMQLFGVLLVAYLLNPAQSFFTVLIYILLGVAGLPVFARGGGVAYLLGPTGGFLFGFLISAPLVSFLFRRLKQNIFAIMTSGTAGLLLIYTAGAIQLAVVTGKGFSFALTAGVLPFIPFDFIKLAITVAIVLAIKKISPEYIAK